MPAARLTDEEQARINVGQCVCGCERTIEVHPSYSYALRRSVVVAVNGAIYAERACRQRAFMARKKAGRVLTGEDRRREKAAEQAIAERAEVAEIERRIGVLRADREYHLKRAAELEAFANGQLEIPGLAAASR